MATAFARDQQTFTPQERLLNVAFNAFVSGKEISLP
jgi:hypothetical protein